VASLVAIGLVFGGIAAFAVSGGVGIGQVLLPALIPGNPVASVDEVEEAVGIAFPPGAISQQPVDDSAYVIGQVRFAGDYADTLVAGGYIELAEIPDRELSVWNGTLDEPHYFVTGDGRRALAGTVDGAYTVTFYAAS
jgi:hypothetical protein